MEGLQTIDGQVMEAIRARYRPRDIRVLFVGESAPASGRFFYLANSSAHSEFRRVLESVIGSDPDFLSAFREAGFFLEDLVLEPVNDMSRTDRRKARESAVPAFAARLADYRPGAVICFMKAIGPLVEAAVRRTDPAIPFHVIPFPGFGQQGRFRCELLRLVPLIRRLSVGRGEQC